jgi:hypothetical protein
VTKVKKNLLAAVKMWSGWMANHGIHFRVKVTAKL